MGQVPVPNGTNEIGAAPELLSMLNLKDAVVSGDAAYTQRKIASQIVRGGGAYCLAVKQNQRTLHAAVEQIFSRRQPSTRHVTISEKNRGRIETRRISVAQPRDLVEKFADWEGIRSLIRVDTRRDHPQAQGAPVTRYYIASLELTPDEAAQYVRGHWQIENNLHRVLDVHFREDHWLMRQKNAAANLSVLRKIAGTMLSQIDRHKTQIATYLICHAARWRRWI